MTGGLDALAVPEPRRLTVAGRDFALTPVRMGKLAAFSKAAMPIAGLVLTGRYVEAVTDHWEGARAAVAVATGADPEWLDDLEPTDFLRLVQAVVEVNGDFFVQRLTPVILAMQAKLAVATAQVGQESQPSSGNTVTH